MPVKGEEEKCPFYFNVWWDEQQQRWYLPSQQCGNKEHKCHMQRTADIAPARSTNLSKELIFSYKSDKSEIFVQIVQVHDFRTKRTKMGLSYNCTVPGKSYNVAML